MAVRAVVRLRVGVGVRVVVLAAVVAAGASCTAPGVRPAGSPEVTAGAPAAPGPTTPDPTRDPTTPTTAPDTATPAVPEGATPSTPPTTALATVGLLEVRGRAPRTGYDRDLFGAGWVDVDRNGCDTRNDVLARDLERRTSEPGKRDCVVLSGTLVDPYGGRTLDVVRGAATVPAVQVDHVVALSDAWQKGAQAWDDVGRTRFANDPLNLLAVDGSLNQQKGDGDTATWLPPDRGYRCAYVARQVAVKHAYGLWVTAAERDAMVRVLTGCPDEPLPSPSTVTPVEGEAPLGRAGDEVGVRCADFGAWPEAQSWYDAHAPGSGDRAGLDGDGDGVACERLTGAP